MARVSKIISGGQTGADTAALEFAIRQGIRHGGWCPRGRKRENGIIATRYCLQETPSAAYTQRTLWNVRDSDATVIFTIGSRLKGGSRNTAEFARSLSKPLLHLSAADVDSDPALSLRRFLRRHKVRVLNVAGPRESEEPAVRAFVKRVLAGAFLSPARPPSRARQTRRHSQGSKQLARIGQ